MKTSWQIRSASLSDVSGLLELEQRCFSYDRISKRSFRHHLQSEHSDLQMVVDQSNQCLAYGLVLNHRGTRLARLYSMAVSDSARGMGLAKALLKTLECNAAKSNRHYMRLEVAKHNNAAISLYQSCGYKIFGEYLDYYEDHTDALRMQKLIRQPRENGLRLLTPWCQQTTEFTCGPASLMMAMASLDEQSICSVELELDIWREATTIFMTSGHGGCHPFGLALAAYDRGFTSEVWVNSEQPLFIDGVRSDVKKQVMRQVHQQFLDQCQRKQISIHYQPLSFNAIAQGLKNDTAILILVSTYRLDGKKAPHWVVITGSDDDCLFVHDPYPSDLTQSAVDCQYVPIAKDDFDKMSMFGSQRLQAAVTLRLR